MVTEEVTQIIIKRMETAYRITPEIKAVVSPKDCPEILVVEMRVVDDGLNAVNIVFIAWQESEKVSFREILRGYPKQGESFKIRQVEVEGNPHQVISIELASAENVFYRIPKEVRISSRFDITYVRVNIEFRGRST